MISLQANLAGIFSPNPFWLASAPPTNTAYNVRRAFQAGWGGVVWKTLIDPPVVNVCSRYGSFNLGTQKMVGFNNIELITDRPLDINLQEITAIKAEFPDRAVVVSLMMPCEEQPWKTMLPKIKATGADGVELNFGCPHGMSERGMGSAIGQVPEYIEQVTRWCKQYAGLPVIVKLTPNITDIRYPARAARNGGADAVSLINTINSIIGVDLDTFAPEPNVDGKGTHGGYCGPAVKPIALNMVAELARDPEMQRLPISGIGGISAWQDAAEFLALGASNVQVCTAVMHHGFRIIDDLTDGLKQWMLKKQYTRLTDFIGKATGNITNWEYLNLNYKTIAHIDQDKCIQCGLCYIACEDTSHQSIKASRINDKRHYEIIDEECVGCNLCQHVCPVEKCITMVPVATGKPFADWKHDPRNPGGVVAKK
jgi:dihydropyrimidine dehydrogenase (NAD+) subunit PreA